MSRIIKMAHYVPSDDSVLLSVRPVPLKTDVESERLQENLQIFKNAEAEAKIIVADAEETAQNMLQQAAGQAEQMKQQALAEIEQWWEQKRAEADRMFQEVRDAATEEGRHIGYEEGKRQALEEEHEAVDQARMLLENAFSEKEQIIAEAEPFLVELSLDVARKVIGDELQQSPEHVLEMSKKALRRSRVHGQISICVNHKYYDLVQEHRHQFLELLDGQAELSIFPDHAVQDGGCVIRTKLGSVDARVDTQLEEIKKALMELAQGRDDR